MSHVLFFVFQRQHQLLCVRHGQIKACHKPPLVFRHLLGFYRFLFRHQQVVIVGVVQVRWVLEVHQICASHQLIDNVVTLLNNEAEIVSDWYKKNFLLANKDKFQAMFLASKAKNTQEAQIVIDNEEIECTSSLNLLGVLIDNKLNFSEHIQQVCQKANCKTGVLSRMKNLVPERTKLHLFKAVILHLFGYSLEHLISGNWRGYKKRD